MKLQQMFAYIIITGALMMTGCQAYAPPISAPVFHPNQYKVLNDDENYSDRYLCTVQPGDSNSLIKTMDLKTRQIRSVFIPGQVKTLAGSSATKKLYAGTTNGQVYEVDIQKNTIKYFLSFNQVALKSAEFVVNNQQLFAVGLQQGKRGSLLSMDLQKKSWKPLAYNVKTGRLAWTGNAHSLQILNMGSQNISRTTVNIKTRQVIHRDYTLNNQDEDNDFYNGVFSPGGRYLYASVNNRIERFERKGNQLVRMTPIELQHVKARYLALSHFGKTLYVSHDQPNRLTRIRLNSGHSSGYSIEEVAFAGLNQQLVVF